MGDEHAALQHQFLDLAEAECAEWWDDKDFTDYGLDPGRLADLRAWALAWAAGLDARLYAEENPDEAWEPYGPSPSTRPLSPSAGSEQRSRPQTPPDLAHPERTARVVVAFWCVPRS
jgi:aryl carrier-like protein